MSRQLIWELGSSNGWAQVSCYATSLPYESEGVQHVASMIVLRAQYWDRVASMRRGFVQGVELVDDVRVLLPQVVLPVPNLQLVEQCLAEWLKQPHPLNDLRLCDGDQTMAISFDISEDLISSVERPVCSLVYRTSRGGHSLKFVTDETCVWRMLSGIHEWLGSVQT